MSNESAPRVPAGTRPALREESVPFRVQRAAPVARMRTAQVGAELRRLVNRRAAALIELEKN